MDGAFFLTFGLIVIINELLELGAWRSVQVYVYIANRSTNADAASGFG
jgi:hypothetical protein